MRALVIGEALIDIVERDGNVTGEYVGGSPLNVAVGLGRLGRPVDFLTHIATDARGKRIRDYVEASGVQLVSGSLTAERTPTARALLDPAGRATYTFDIDWQLSGTPEAATPGVLHTGSIATVLEPGCLATAALVEAYRPSATITFDPNIRPALIDDPDAARSRVDRLLERADVVKVSDEDLRWLEPARTPEEVASAWLGAGPSVVVVTEGADGAVAMCRAGKVRVPAGNVQVVDTVGAGDAFMTGLIDALWSLDLLGAQRRSQLHAIGTDALTTAVRAATLTAAVTVTRSGADLPDRASLRHAAESSDILG
ncbi:ribokinase [Mycobacterium sp. Soil538]|nr:ribokinase [Mycobacterium sp. Soil538]